MKLARPIALAALGTLLCSTTAAAQDSPEAQAQAILKKARDAAGGEAKLKSIQSLSYNGKSKRMVRMMMMTGGGDSQQQPAPSLQENDFEVDILAPDKYVRRDTREISNMAATLITHTGFNGDQLITRREVIGDLPAMPNFGAPPDPAAIVRRSKQSFLRDWLALGFEPAGAYGVTYRSLGTETVNNATYNVVEATAPDDFTAKLYFDASTNRLAMMRYRAPGGMQSVRMGGPPPAGAAPGGNPPPQGEGQQQRVFQRPAGPMPDVDYEIVYSDYKAVDGVQLPHRFRRSSNGELADETEIKRYKLNSNPKADKFKTTD